MEAEIPEFRTVWRGADFEQVHRYITSLHNEMSAAVSRSRTLEQRMVTLEAERRELHAEVTRLEMEASHAPTPLEEASDQITQMMRAASEEIRTTKQRTQEEAESILAEIAEEREAVRRDREAVNAETEEARETMAAQRDEIIAQAQATAESIVAEANRSHSRMVEEDARHRDESQRRMNSHLESMWNHVEQNVAARERNSRAEAERIVASATQEAAAVRERIRTETAEALQLRDYVMSGLTEIGSHIESALARTRFGPGNEPASDEDAGARHVRRCPEPAELLPGSADSPADPDDSSAPRARPPTEDTVSGDTGTAEEGLTADTDTAEDSPAEKTFDPVVGRKTDAVVGGIFGDAARPGFFIDGPDD